LELEQEPEPCIILLKNHASGTGFLVLFRCGAGTEVFEGKRKQTWNQIPIVVIYVWNQNQDSYN